MSLKMECPLSNTMSPQHLNSERWPCFFSTRPMTISPQHEFCIRAFSGAGSGGEVPQPFQVLHTTHTAHTVNTLKTLWTHCTLFAHCTQCSPNVHTLHTMCTHCRVATHSQIPIGTQSENTNYCVVLTWTPFKLGGVTFYNCQIMVWKVSYGHIFANMKIFVVI